MKKSKVITFIGGFYIFGGVIVLLSLLFHGSQLNTVLGLSNIPDPLIKLSVGMLYIPLGYFYVKRRKPVNWIILVCAILTFCISADLAAKWNSQPYIGNLIYSLFVILATVIRRKEFKKE